MPRQAHTARSALTDPPPRAPAETDRSAAKRVFALQIGCSLTIRTWWGYSYGRTAAPHEPKRDDGDTDGDVGGSRALLVPAASHKHPLALTAVSSEAARAHLMDLGAASADAALPAVHANGWLPLSGELSGPSIQVLAPIA